MHFKTRRIIASVVVIGAVAAGGAVYTAGSGFGNVPTSSYAGTTIAGAATSALTFNYSEDGSHILAANFTLTPANLTDNYADTATYEIQAGFGVDSSQDGTPGATGLQAATSPFDVEGNICVASGNLEVPATTSPVAAAISAFTTVTCSFASPGIPVSDTNDTIPANNDTPGVLSGHDSTTNPSQAAIAGVNLDNSGGAHQFNVLVTTINPTS
jgi:hypothetical protein